MNDGKSKFVIKKSSQNFRLKIPTAEEIQFNNSQKKEFDDKTQKVLNTQIDSFNFISKEQKVIKRHVSENLGKEIFVAKYSPDDNKIAVTMLDGSLAIVGTKHENKKRIKQLSSNGPLTSVVWKNSKQLLVGDTSGTIYDLDFNKIEGEITLLDQYSDPSEQILTMERSDQLGINLYAGKSMKITAMSDNNKKALKTYEPGDVYALGHTNRIFCLKFSDTIPNMFISGGWDGTLFIWDIRTNKASNSIFGPTISGDSLDICDNLILAGSYRDKDSLELYDLRTLKKICNIEWSFGSSGHNYISSCKFSRNKEEADLIIAGCCLSNQVGIFKKEIVYKNELVISDISKGVYTCGFANNESKFFFANSEGSLNVYHYFNM